MGERKTIRVNPLLKEPIEKAIRETLTRHQEAETTLTTGGVDALTKALTESVMGVETTVDSRSGLVGAPGAGSE